MVRYVTFYKPSTGTIEHCTRVVRRNNAISKYCASFYEMIFLSFTSTYTTIFLKRKYNYNKIS